MALKYRIVAEGGDRMCRVCESFDGKEFYMVEFEEGVNAPPFHPNCRCTYEVFEDNEIVNKPLYMPFDGTTVLVPPFFQRSENYIEAASTLVSFEQIKQETAKIRNDITASTPYVSVNGEPYSKPLNGIAIINWVRKNGIRVANGKDYSKVTRIGIGFSPYDVDILAEYEKYKRSEANPISYEVFANICSPYWAADLESDIKVNIHKYSEKLIQAISSDSTQQAGSNKKTQNATQLDSNGYGKLARFFNERRLNISRNYENEPENWEIQLQKSLELYKDKIPYDLTEEERNKLMDEIILFEAKVLQDRYRATYSSSEHIISKALNQGLHKKLEPLYTQYKTSEKETNGLLRAAADGFSAGFNAGLTSEVISSVKFGKGKNRINSKEYTTSIKGLKVTPDIKGTFEATVEKDPSAFLHFKQGADGGIYVTGIRSGTTVSGSKLLVESIKTSGLNPTRKLVFKTITNAETHQAYLNGTNAADSLMGKSGAKALKLLGKTPSDMYFEVVKGQPELVINLIINFK